jgi:hypothetical protein
MVVAARLQRRPARTEASVIEARIAPLLVLAWQPGVHRDLGFASRDVWVRERLGMDPTRARALVRLERACAESPPLARAWRTGLSWVKASALVPLVSADPLGRFVPDWVRWAERVTVRRLRDDVEQALAQAETDPEAFRDDGGLPPQARRRPATDEARDGAQYRRGRASPGRPRWEAPTRRDVLGAPDRASGRGPAFPRSAVHGPAPDRGGHGPTPHGRRGARRHARPRVSAVWGFGLGGGSSE